MALTKQCTCCFKTKPLEQFSKNSRAKDGKQFHCKECNKKENLKFRTEINPNHHAVWQSNNRDKAAVHVSKYRKGDKPGLIYYIQNPNGEYYIGMTKTYLNVRLIEHKVKWKRNREGKSNLLCPLLFDSFDKWGFENHKTGIIIKDEKANRKQLRKWESETIKFFMNKGISLNKQI